MFEKQDLKCFIIDCQAVIDVFKFDAFLGGRYSKYMEPSIEN